MAARPDILEKVKKSRQQAEQRILENNRKAAQEQEREKTQAGYRKNSPMKRFSNPKRVGNEVTYSAPKSSNRNMWYKGDAPTETETIARIMEIGKKDEAEGRELFSMYEKSKKAGHWKETYEKATSSYMSDFGLNSSDLTDDFFEANAYLLDAGTHTNSGNLSSAKKYGVDSQTAEAFSELWKDYNATKELKAEQDAIVKEARYWMSKGLTDDEIKRKLNISGENTRYSKISNAIAKSKLGEFVPTTDTIWAATSWGVDGMLWSLRNPEDSSGDFFADAIKRDMGRGKSYTSSQADIDRRTMGSDTWSPYTNGTTMDDAAITLGVNGKEGFAPDYWEKNRNRILTTGTDAEKKAFEESWKAEEFTRKAEEEAGRFKEAFEKGIASGMRPEEFFASDFFESNEFDALKKLYDGWYTGNPAEVTRAIDFDIADYMKQAQASYDKRMGTYTTDEYEQNLSNATGGSYQPDESKTEVHNYKDWNEGILLKDFSPSATKKEQQSFRISAHMPVFTDVSVQTSNAIQNGKGGAKQMHEAQLKATNDYANDHYYAAMDAINGVGTVYSEMDDATVNTIKEYFPGKYEAGELPTREDVDALLASMPDVNTAQMQADFQNVASDFAYGDVKMEEAMPGAQQFVEKYMPGWDGEFLPTLDDVQAAMQSAGQEKAAVQSMWEGIVDDVDQAGVRYAERQQAAADAEKELANIYGMYAEMYGEGSEQYNSAIATFEVNYQFKRGVPKEWQAFDHYQQRSMQDGYDPAMSAGLLSTMRGENAKEMKWVSDYLENAKLSGADEDIIANMESYLADLQKQNKLLDAHKLQQNADYADKVLEFDAAYTASENAVLDNSSRAGNINSIIANPGVGRAYYRSQMGQQGSQTNSDYLIEYEENAAVMTDEERNNYKYIAVTQGVEAAAQYFLDLQDNLTVRAYQQQQEDVREFAGENVVNAGVATVGSVLLTPFEAMEGIDTLVRGLFGEDINPYEHKAGMVKSASREGTKDLAKEAWGEESAAYKVFEVVYDASTSGADSMLTGHMGGSTVGALLMGLGGFENAVNDARMRGASNEDAILYGAVSALIEAGTEKLDIDRMFKAFDAGAEGTKSFLKTIAQGFGAEGLEEALSSIGTTIADDAIMQAMSNRDLAIQEYMALGLTEDEAKAQAGRDILTDVLYSGLVGGVSGTFTSAIEYGAGKIVGEDRQVNTEQNESEQPTEENTTEEAEPEGEPAAEEAENQAPAEQPAAEQTGTPQERTVAALATANQNGVGERQQAATIAGVFQSWGVRAEAGISAAKNIASNGWGMVMQRVAAAAQDAPRLMEALSVAANSASSQCAAVMNETFTNAKEQVGKLMEALTADQQNADVQSEYNASVTQSMEADVTASLEAEAENSNADLKAAKKGVEDAQTNVNDARTKYLEAQKTLEQARVSMEATRERFLQNPGDDNLRQQYSEKIKNWKKAGETAHANAVALNSLMTIFGKANNHLKSVTDQIANTCREQAKAIVAERNAEYAKQQAEQTSDSYEEKAPESVQKVNGNVSQPKTGVSQFASQTGQNTTVLSDEVKKQLRESPYYQKTSQKGNMDRAISLIESEGYEARRNKLLDGTTNLFSPEGQVEAYALAKVAKEMGDTVGESSIAFKVKESGTLLGQSMAMRRMYVEMTPEGKQMYVQRIVDQINARYERAGKDTRVSAPDWLAERLEQAAGDDAQTEAVLNEAYLAIADQMPPDWKTKINGWRYLSMLANPKTHIRNFLGNALFAPAVSIKNQIGALIEIVSGSTERTKTLGKVDRKYKDYAKTQLDGVKDILSGGGKQNPMDVIQQNRKTFDSKLLEWLGDKNSEWLEKGDAFFLNRHFVNSLAGYLQANKADLNDLPNAMLHQALDYAINEAQKATYRDASELADRISRFTRDGKTLGTKVAGVLVEGALPFKKTPINVMRRGIEYSPVGLIDTMIRGRRNLKKGKITQAEFFDSVASGLTGTALSMVGAWMYSLGAIELDLDEPEDELKKLQGKQEYSLNLKLFGEDISFTIDWLSPSAMPLFTGAAIADLYTDEDKEVNLSGLWDAMLNLTEPMFNLSMLDGVNKLLSAASNSENGVMDVAMQAAEGYATQFVPTVLGAFARIADPVRRTTYTDKNSGVPSTLQYLWDSTINKIPGMSAAGQPYLNAWGEEDVTGNIIVRAIENLVSPGYLNEVDTEGVESALMELFDTTGDTGILPKAPQKYFTVDGERKDLTGEEYELLTKERGTMAKKLHEELFSDPRFYEASAEYQVKALKNVWEYATQLAKHHIDENYTPDTWIRNATDPKEAILQKMSENMKSDQKESFKAGVYDAVEAGDFENAETCIAGWKSMGGTDKSLKTYLTSKYQLKYRDLYAAGDLEGLEEIRQNLYALDIGFTGADFMTWLSEE